MINKEFITKKPNLDLILRYIQNDVSHQEVLYMQQMLKSNPDWLEMYNQHKEFADVMKHLPAMDPPPRVWAKIKSEIRQTQRKPLWQIKLEEYFQHNKIAWASACSLFIAAVLYAQVLMQPGFQIVDVSDVHGFSLEADTYIANHEIIYNDPVTQETLLAFYPVETNSSFDEE